MNDKSEFDYVTAFPPLGHPEHHFNKYPNHPWLKTRNDIDEWLSVDVNKDMYQINEDLTVSIFAKIFYFRDKIGYLPIQFRDIQEMNLNNSNIKDLVGISYSLKKLFLYGNNLNELKDLKVNENIEYINLGNNNLKNFIDIPKAGIVVLENNPIKSWEGFKGCEKIGWWQKEWSEETSYDLLMKTPDSIKEISLSSSFNHPSIIRDPVGINMNWLRKEQLKIRIERDKEVIDNYVSDSFEKKIKRRKL